MLNTDIIVVRGKKFRKSSFVGITKAAAAKQFKDARVDDDIVAEAWELSQPEKEAVEESPETEEKKPKK